MDGWNQLSALLLLLVCADGRVTVAKTIGRGPDATPVCMSENLGRILFVSCRISTRRHHNEECRLQYLFTDKYLNHDCDSRFRLINVNRTVFIQLMSLTPEDSGNYTCECSYEKGTNVSHLNIIVNYGDGSFSSLRMVAAVVVVTVAVTVIGTAGILCCILKRNKRDGEAGALELRRSETLYSVIPDDCYASLQCPTNDVYQTLSSRPHGAEADPTHREITEYECICQEMDGKGFDSFPVYETC